VLAVASCGVSRGEDEAGGATETSETDADADAAEPDGSEADATPTTAAPTTATTGAPGDVAASVEFADGAMAELRHGELNEIVVPTQENIEFVTLVYQGSVPPGFDAVVLSQTVLAEVLDNELAKLDTDTSEANLDEAREILFQQIESLLTASADPTADAERLYEEVPYLPFIAELQARQIALSSRLAESADAGAGEGNPCVRHILVESESEADEILAELAAEADFAELAAEHSIDPTGQSGGDLGCAAAEAYVPEFATAVSEAEVGEFVGPVETEFGFHVLVVDGYEVNGDDLANEIIRDGLAAATVEVDDRLGTWDTEQLVIVPVGS
jgi:hypothetical protein